VKSKQNAPYMIHYMQLAIPFCHYGYFQYLGTRQIEWSEF